MPAKFLNMLFLFGFLGCGLVVQAPDSVSESSQVKDSINDREVERIEFIVASYAAAFNARDVDKLAEFWTNEGVYLDQTTGEKTVGRESLKAQFSALFSEASAPTLELETTSIEFVSPNVALERGVANVKSPMGESLSSEYSAVFVKSNGVWKIDRVTEKESEITTKPEDPLRVLDWLIGDWVLEGDEYRMEFSCEWTVNENFVSRRYSVIDNDEVSSTGLQIIGWDANKQQITSWLFDSDGGTVTGNWTERDGRWIVQSTAKLRDGGIGSYSSIIRPLDDNSFGWKKINRVLDGKPLPNLDEVVVTRKVQNDGQN